MSGRHYKKARVRNLHLRDPLCHWCRKETIIVDGHFKQTIRNKATLDHLRDRFDSTRWEPNRNREERTVLACWDCNHKRAQARQAELVELQRYKSVEGMAKKWAWRQRMREAERAQLRGDNVDCGEQPNPGGGSEDRAAAAPALSLQ